MLQTIHTNANLILFRSRFEFIEVEWIQCNTVYTHKKEFPLHAELLWIVSLTDCLTSPASFHLHLSKTVLISLLCSFIEEIQTFKQMHLNWFRHSEWGPIVYVLSWLQWLNAAGRVGARSLKPKSSSSFWPRSDAAVAMLSYHSITSLRS